MFQIGTKGGKMRTQRNLVGNKYGKLLVVESCGQKANDRHYFSKVRCECGKEYLVPDTELIYGRRRGCTSCGNGSWIHGKTNTKLFNVWASMKQRCLDKNHKNYKDYGGRGIKICDEWLNDFKTFYEWAMSNGYKEELSIDRIDNNGNYEPSNCRWADLITQANNKRNSRIITYKGKTDTLPNWARKYNIHPTTLAFRLKNGWSVERALNLRPKIGRNQYDK